MTSPQLDIEQVWNEYKQSGERHLRNRLMEHYLPIVRYTAERLSAKLPNEVDVDDLISSGIFGLLDAIEAFDLTRGVKFETYCSPRVRGAILDELRSMDWVPRLVRSRAQKLETATKALKAELGRLPSDAEIAGRLDVNRSELTKMLRDANTVSLISLSRKYQDHDSNRELHEIDVLQDRHSEDPLDSIQKRDLHEFLMKDLSRTERLIIVLYYYEQLTMKEIGVVLDLSESRVSQMHSGILVRLMRQLVRGGELQYER